MGGCSGDGVGFLGVLFGFGVLFWGFFTGVGGFFARLEIKCYIKETDIQTLKIHISMLSLLQNSSLEVIGY